MNKCRRVFLAAFLLLACGAPAGAVTLPAVKADARNAVPTCATPGRLMAYLRARNPQLDSRFETIAVEYMRHGEALGIRWDFGFYQMILETGALAFKRGNGKPGDVRPAQNNFAGLGATGGGEKGESFPDVSTGVRAHLEHILMYSGHKVEAPVAERTRKVQEWGVLTSWQKGFKKPITFADIGRKWAPGDRSYGSSIESIAEKFDEEHCKSPDPAPQLVAQARSQKVAAAEAPASPPAAAPSSPPADHDRLNGEELAREAIERARRDGDNKRSALGAGSLAKTATTSRKSKDSARGSVRTPGADQGSPETEPKAETAKVDPPDKPAVTPASAGSAAKRTTAVAALPKVSVPEAAPGKCRVWTASYGGQKSVIIRAKAEDFTNYTVLDVNEGAETRETDAYIEAYAKDGQKVGDFASQEQALEQAFKLCPEG